MSQSGRLCQFLKKVVSDIFVNKTGTDGRPENIKKYAKEIRPKQLGVSYFLITIKNDRNYSTVELIHCYCYFHTLFLQIQSHGP